ncbi:response regulator transcription factor [Actinospica durhamensis]|uniref:Response regulator transcription factor n=1 Tax=Actinospica durhamensis TaxID=1508375 RepID=A0A941IRQ7_9ACTN|nr:response regulator transcription factor [Actinospica durhamensis]MBR7832511.1 response regulator transcription factor [Actinospica durhamensis]
MTTERKITVLLVDDHALVREGVREILSLEPDMVVVAEAADSEQAVERVAEHKPDIVLLDVEIPGRHATDTVARIRTVSPRSRIIVLSMYDGPQLLRRLVDAGIRGYLLKSVDSRELVAAVRGVHQNPDRMVMAISRESLSQMQDTTEKALTQKEIAILRMVAQALSNSQIASRLDMAEATVKRHLHSVFVKLGAVSRIDAVNKAVAASLISARPEDTPARPATGRGRR